VLLGLLTGGRELAWGVLRLPHSPQVWGCFPWKPKRREGQPAAHLGMRSSCLLQNFGGQELSLADVGQQTFRKARFSILLVFERRKTKQTNEVAFITRKIYFTH